MIMDIMMFIMIMMIMMAMMTISIIYNDDEIVTIGRAIRPSRSHVGKTGLE